MIEAFSPTPPQWAKTAIHAVPFCCPKCQNSSHQATKVWLNRYSPVLMENYRRKWQEFYLCECGQSWWAWSNDRQPTEDFNNQD